MLGAALCMLAIANSAHESVMVREFTLTTSKGQSVFHQDFDRRQLTDVSDKLKLAFNAIGEKFQFEFQPSSIFADDAIVKMTGNGTGYIQLPVPEVLSFSSPGNDAAITFVNSTTVDGVVFQHGRAFDIVASADSLVLRPVIHDVHCGVGPHGPGHHKHHHHRHPLVKHGRLLSLKDIEWWNDCYPGQAKTHVMTVGVGITSGLYTKRFAEQLSKATAWVTSIVARANVVFMRQMNVKLEVKELLVVTPKAVQDKVQYTCADTSTAKNQFGKGCADFNNDAMFTGSQFYGSTGRFVCDEPFTDGSKPTDVCCICGGGNGNGGVPPWNNGDCKITSMGDQLELINPTPTARKSGVPQTWHPPSKQGAWHIFDDCFNPDVGGTAGIAFSALHQPSGTYKLTLDGDKVRVDRMPRLASPLISLEYNPMNALSNEVRKYVFTTDGTDKIYIKYANAKGQVPQLYARSSVSGQGTTTLTFTPTVDDQTSSGGLHLYYQLGENTKARGSIQISSRREVFCGTFNNVGVNMYHTLGDTWKTFAHEVGHNLGGTHPFFDEEIIAKGATGGLMDYNENEWYGALQFGTFNQMRICPVIKALIEGSCPHIQSKTTTCGDGVVGIGEQCECKDNLKSCRHCQNCALVGNAQCTPDAAVAPEAQCCLADGTFATVSTMCDVDANTKGYCRAGVCDAASKCFTSYKNTRLTKFCGVSDSNQCLMKCGTDSVCYDSATENYGKREVNDGSICMYGSQRGTCQSGACVLPTQCGNGVLQGNEECECASGTSCKFCSNCKLEQGKECAPDSPCCDDEGKFLTTSKSCTKQPEGVQGYCNRGVCATITTKCRFQLAVSSTESIQTDKFCGTSGSNPCKAKCGNKDQCVDTSNFQSGGVLLANGALCSSSSGLRGECNEGSCDVNVVCGNGVVQGSEECECPSGQTQCRHCTNCKLDAGKDCTPDADAVCCSEQGIAATSSVQCTMSDGKQGYCNRGKCSTYTCNVNVDNKRRHTFCGVLSGTNTCWAKCKGDDDVCVGIGWGTKETIANGAFCETTKGERGTCGSGSCNALQQQPKKDGHTNTNACLTNRGGCHSQRTCTATDSNGGRICGDCADGYVNDGDTGCKATGGDTSGKPKCTGSNANPPTNGKVEKSNGDLHGSVATFSCNSGYALSGAKSITCNAATGDAPWQTPSVKPSCTSIGNGGDTAAKASITLEGNYDTVVGSKKQQFLDECTQKLSSNGARDVKCVDVKSGPTGLMIVDVRGENSAVTNAVQKVAGDGFLDLPSFEKVAVQKKTENPFEAWIPIIAAAAGATGFVCIATIIAVCCCVSCCREVKEKRVTSNDGKKSAYVVPAKANKLIFKNTTTANAGNYITHVNGAPVNTGIKLKLTHGDKITFKNGQLAIVNGKKIVITSAAPPAANVRPLKYNGALNVDDNADPNAFITPSLVEAIPANKRNMQRNWN